jgi:hypothetical protein
MGSGFEPAVSAFGELPDIFTVYVHYITNATKHQCRSTSVVANISMSWQRVLKVCPTSTVKITPKSDTRHSPHMPRELNCLKSKT